MSVELPTLNKYKYNTIQYNTAFGDQPTSSMSKFSASVNSDPGNGYFWVEIGEAEHVDRCSWKYTRVWSCQLTSDLKRRLLFWKRLQWSCLKAVSVPTFVLGGLRGSTTTSAERLLSGVGHRGHYEGLSRCRLVGSCMLPGKKFFTLA